MLYPEELPKHSMPKISMVMADIDGTLVTPTKTLTEQAKQTIYQLKAAEIKFTLISSRPPYGMNALAQELQIDQPLVAFNGGMTITPDGQLISEHLLQANLIPEILDCLRQYGVSPRLFTSDAWLIESPNQPHVEDEIYTLGSQPTIVQDFTPYLGHILKITGVSDDAETTEKCQNTLQRMLQEQASILCSQSFYLDITDKLANKGNAVIEMSALKKIPKTEIAVIGDMHSDVPMFQEAGLSIAMGNATDDVKRQATYQTDTNANEGFAKAISHYILNPITTTIS